MEYCMGNGIFFLEGLIVPIFGDMLLLKPIISIQLSYIRRYRLNVGVLLVEMKTSNWQPSKLQWSLFIFLLGGMSVTARLFSRTVSTISILNGLARLEGRNTLSQQPPQLI
jgi:hypothetical protein